MRQAGALIALVFGACSGESEPVANACPTVQAAVAQAPRAGVPHAANIREVATTDAGDAAISLDDAGGIRVWPTLDGTREPIALDVQAPIQIALAPTGVDLLAGVVDQSGSAQLLRVTRTGHVTGRWQVPGEIPIVQLVGERDGMLALRADQTIDRIDGTGVVREHLVSDPGERIATIVARSGAAAAVLDLPRGTTLRWIEHGAWGARVTLPVAVRPDSVALSPSHHRLAAGKADANQLVVYELGVSPRDVPGTSVQLREQERVGFTDDDHLVTLSAGGMRWWTARKPGDDPWAPTTPPNPGAVTTGNGAVANGRAIAGANAALALVTETSTRYLGWQDVGLRDAAFVGDHIAVSASQARWLWLDDHLVARSTLELDKDVAYGQVLDAHHAVIDHEMPGSGELLLEVVDTEHPKDRATLGRFKNVQRFDWEPSTRVFSVMAVGALHRWKIDGAVTPLRDVKMRADYSYVRFSSAPGVVAIGAVADPTGMRIETVHDDGTIEKVRTVAGEVVAIDDAGAIYMRIHGENVVVRGDVETKLPALESLIPSSRGDSLAAFSARGLAMYDRDGHERWRRPVWNVYAVAFAPGDRELHVRALGGVMVIDVQTGEPRATACGWRFGLTDHAPDTTPAGIGTVCEDSE